MKSLFNLSILIILTSLIGCSKSNKSSNCNIDCNEPNYSIYFNEGEAQNLTFSPIEKNKILVDFFNSSSRKIEFDLCSNHKEKIQPTHWKNSYSNKIPTYIDSIDSLVWIGGANRNLICYDQKLKKTRVLPIKYVNQIIPFESKLFFVSFHGLYVKTSTTSDIIKLKNIPIELIQRSSQLNRNTLLLDSKITFDLKTNTWKEGIHLFDTQLNGKFYTISKNKENLLFQENGKLYSTLNNSIHEINVTNEFSRGIIYNDANYVYSKRKGYIDRYEINTGKLDSFKFRLPKSRFAPNFKFDNDIIWIFRPGQLSFINTSTKSQHLLPLGESTEFKSFEFDNCHVFLLYAKELNAIHKNDFIQNTPTFDIDAYENEIIECKTFIDSTKIQYETDEYVAIQKLKEIQNKYSNSENPEIIELISYLNIGAFQNVNYNSTIKKEACYKNENLPFEQRIYCFNNLITEKARNSEFQEAIKQEKILLELFNSEKLQSTYYHKTGLDSIKSYLSKINSLSKSKLSQDTLSFYKAMALNTVCETMFFCHEGCGGCDYSLVTNELEKFKTEFPSSRLLDNAEFKLIGYEFMYDENMYSSQKIRRYENFKNNYPNSDLHADADYIMIQHILYSENTSAKNTLNNRIKSFIHNYDGDERIKVLLEMKKQIN